MKWRIFRRSKGKKCPEMLELMGKRDRLIDERNIALAALDSAKHRAKELKATVDGCRAANKEMAEKIDRLEREARERSLAMERAREILVDWRNSDPQFTEIIQGVIDDFDDASADAAWPDGAGQAALDLKFGLSYASWFVLPRAVMNRMPDLWKGRFAALWSEFDAEFGEFPSLDYNVMAKGPKGRFVKLPDAMCNYRHPDVATIDTWRSRPPKK